MTPRRLLVYHPDAAEARAYGALVTAPRRVVVDVAWTPADAAKLVADVEILYGWQFPSDLLGRAPALRWIQSMGAGVERFLVPALPARVVLTRVAGIFGPWMAEYTLAWCFWVTQRIDLFRAQQRQRRWAEVNPLPLRRASPRAVAAG